MHRHVNTLLGNLHRKRHLKLSGSIPSTCRAKLEAYQIKTRSGGPTALIKPHTIEPRRQEQVAAVLVCALEPPSIQDVHQLWHGVQVDRPIETRVVCPAVAVLSPTDPAKLCSAVRTSHMAARIGALRRYSTARASSVQRLHQSLLDLRPNLIGIQL